ncbi:hypothetical protein EG68_02117 [Paragonimus skrjabini miyazakii]|uniref:Uncharacterized protein n=1 Tax=Paragonimus skrjabini miyazakii TaxID=59628 RepID=A0A8S9Z3Z9_9TREM|nr:hypothetical protein EG68_02117 [Paragonimus skrjabini miyazakii]
MNGGPNWSPNLLLLMPQTWMFPFLNKRIRRPRKMSSSEDENINLNSLPGGLFAYSPLKEINVINRCCSLPTTHEHQKNSLSGGFAASPVSEDLLSSFSAVFPSTGRRDPAVLFGVSLTPL